MRKLNKNKASFISEKIFEIEKELDLFKKKIQGVYFWKLIRFEIFMQLTQKLDVYEQAHSKEFNSIFDRIKAVFPKLKNTYLHSVFSRNTRVDVLVIEHGRKVLIDNKYIDIYTEYKVRELEKNNISYEIIDKPYLGKHYDKPSQKRSYGEEITINFLINYLFSFSIFNEKEKKIIIEINNKIKEKYNIILDLEKIIKTKVKLFKIRKKQFSQMLKNRNVRKVYIVVSYTSEHIISACQDLHIKCIELQHGTMNKFHVGYSFPDCKKIPYFPDKIEIFGKYWQDSTPLPIKNENILITGYPYLNTMIDKYKEQKKIKNRILFISQGTVATDMTKILLDILKQNADLEIYYKLHPGEFDRWRNDYTYLVEANKYNNLIIVENEIPLYELLATSEFLIGVYSTVIFEGLTLQCKTILLDLEGVEFLEYLIKKDIVKIAKESCDVLKLIKKDDFITIDRDYFFKEIK